MIVFFNLINNVFGPYFNSLRKSLAQKKITPLTTTHAPNLIGHPIGIAMLFADIGVSGVSRNYVE